MISTDEIIHNGKTLTEILRLHKCWLSSDSGERANLSSADLRSANLSYANLSYADLSSADLHSANLSSANLRSADLRFECFQLSRIGSENRMTTWDATNDIVWCGCFKGTMQEFSEQVEKTHANNPKYLTQYRSAINYLKSLKQISEEYK